MKFTRGRFQILQRCEVFFDISSCVYAIVQGKLKRYLFELAKHGRIQHTDLRQEIISAQQIFSAPDSSFCRKTARQIPMRPNKDSLILVPADLSLFSCITSQGSYAFLFQRRARFKVIKSVGQWRGTFFSLYVSSSFFLHCIVHSYKRNS